ncbi:hypothetical protein BaRGS_00023167 [Batillaria attramentaria]|uniref:Myb/SANT-like DNA-binding domain-containing protein n=1 Tax=Batillaria attramentaria TaxID=370345 RepID=A0ABD0KEX1_9CAEN
MEKTKRARKANFSTEEIRVLLEEMQMEYATLCSSLSVTITRDSETEIWQRIIEKVNSCGVSLRTTHEVEEKWRALKGSVLNKKREEKKTGEPGEGPAPAPVPLEDILLIIGEKSNLFSGVTGE